MPTYRDVLRQLVVNDRGLIDALSSEGGSPAPCQVDARSRVLARVAAIVAHDGSIQTFRWTIGEALDLGVTPDEIVGLMLAIAPIVGSARIVDTTPKVAMALDYDLDDALESPGP